MGLSLSIYRNTERVKDMYQVEEDRHHEDDDSQDFDLIILDGQTEFFSFDLSPDNSVFHYISFYLIGKRP